MMKLLMGRAFPAAVAAMLLRSSISPIGPALKAFSAATTALTGEDVENSGADVSQIQVPDAAKVAGAGGGLSGLWDKLFGKSNKQQAKDQLDDIINHVKQQGGANANDALPPGKSGSGPGGDSKAGGKGGAKGKGKGKAKE